MKIFSVFKSSFEIVCSIWLKVSHVSDGIVLAESTAIIFDNLRAEIHPEMGQNQSTRKITVVNDEVGIKRRSKMVM